MKKRRIIKIFIIITTIVFLYYQLFYKRYYIYNKDKTKVITIWPTFGNKCYIIPKKYKSIISPQKDYIKTKNYKNYFGIVFDTKDNYDFKISIYNDFEIVGLDNVKVYSKTDSLLLEYKMLDSLNYQTGIRNVNPNQKIIEKKIDFVYIDMNRLFGIKVYYPNSAQLHRVRKIKK